MNTFNIPFAKRTVHWALACLLAVAQTMGQSYDWKWSYALNSNEPEHFHAVAVDSTEGSILVVGDAQNTSLSPTLPTLSNRDQAVVYKYDSWGSVRWKVAIIGSDEATPEHIAIGRDGTVFITGVYTATCHFTSANGTVSTDLLVALNGSKDIYLAAFSPNGEFLWARSIGDQYDEGYPDLAVDNTGIILTGTFRSTNAAVGGPTQASIFLNRYDLDGDPIWSVIGGTANDDQPTTIDSDGERFYLGAIAGGNTFRWQHTGTGQWNITNQTEADHVISAFLLDGSWAWSMSITDPSNNAVGRPNLVATCAGVFVTGAVGSGSTFPNASPITSGNASAYLMRLQAQSGVVDFVRTGYGTSGGARFNPRDISTGKWGLIHIGGTFEGTVNFSASIISATNGADAFVMTAGHDGTLKQLTAITGHDDQILSGIAADQYGGVIVSGAFEDEIAIPAHPLSGSTSDRHAFVAFAQFGDRAADPHNPALFTLPDAICTGASIDLNERLIASATGSGTAVVTSTSATAITNALGPWDNVHTRLQGGGGSITLALGDTLPAGEALHIRWRATSAGMSLPTLRIETSVDGSNWILGTATSSRTEAVISQRVLAAPTRYVRLTAPTSGTILDIDGVIHTTGSIPGGTWSGTGVTGSNFTPTASGSSAITYTTGVGSCSRSTTHNINVEALPVGGSISTTIGGQLCPNANSGVLTLTGHTGVISGWESSTDNFVNSTSITNTTTTHTFSNLTQSTSFRARVDQVGCGSTTSGSISVLVGDIVAPTIVTCPGSNTRPVSDGCTVSVPDFVPLAAATDNCTGALTWSQSPVAGTAVYKGDHLVTLRVMDATGNYATCQVSLIAVDTIAPVISGQPSSVVLNALPGTCSAPYSFVEPTATDNCGPVIVTSRSQSVGIDSSIQVIANGPYPVGVTTKVYTFTDVAGNTDSCSFTITVVDTETPVVVNCPTDLTVPTTSGICGAVVNYPPPVFSDNCAFRRERTAGGASGTFFPIGTTTVTYTARDSAGNTASCSFSVTVQDLQDPALFGCPSNIVVQASLNGTSAPATWAEPSASDNCGPVAVTRTGGLAPGSTFTIGTHHIAYTAIDQHGRSASCTFTVTVVGNDAPLLVCPPNTEVNTAPGLCTATYSYAAPIVTDDQPGWTLSQIDGTGITSGSPFPTGNTVQTWAVVDSDGHVTQCSFTIEVKDLEPPTIANCPVDTTLTADVGGCGATFTYADPIATDNCSSASPLLISGLASGSFFPIGPTPLRFQATDAFGNVATCDLVVTVIDNTPPTIVSCSSDTTINAELNACGAHFSFAAPVLSDNCIATLVQMTGPTSGALFPIGTTTVTYRAVDAAGLADSCSFTVTVQDIHPPTFVSCPDTIVVTADPTTCGAVVNHSPPTVTDNCTASTTLTAGPPSGATFPTGNTAITYRAFDGTNSSTCTFTVAVVDNQPPTIIGLPNNLTVPSSPGQCGAMVTWSEPTGMDNCPSAVTIGVTSGLYNGDVFPVGTTPVTYQVNDGVQSTASTFLVTVMDQEQPVIHCPSDTVIQVQAACAALFDERIAVATDNCGVDSIVQTTAFPFGQPIGPGHYTISYRAYDQAMNSSGCSFSLTVVDTTAPTITCPAHPPLSASDDCTAVLPDYTVDAVVGDNCTFNPIVQHPIAGSEVVAGTLVTLSITDASMNSSSCSFIMDVIDQTAPTIQTPPTDQIFTSTTGTCGLLYVFPTITSIDNCDSDTETDHRTFLLEDGDPAWQDVTGLPDHALAPGVHQLYQVHRDDNGNTDTCSWKVTVLDTAPPLITTSGNITINAAPNTCGATVNFTINATDNCAILSLTQSHNDGDFFPVGTTTITSEATDINGNASTGVPFTITILDNAAPSVTCPLNDTLRIDLGVDCMVAFPDLRDSLTVADCGSWTNTMLPSAGTVFTRDTVLYMTMWIEDAAGNGRWNNHWVHIIDNDPPSFTPLADQIIPLDSTGHATIADLTVLYTDVHDCSTPVIISQDVLPGTSIDHPTSIIVRFVDAVGRTAYDTLVVTPADHIAPTLICPSNTIVAATGGACGTQVSFLATATDNIDLAPAITYSQGPGSWFNLDSTLVTVTATDQASNTATCAFTVTVLPTPLPELRFATGDHCSTAGAIVPDNTMPVGGTFDCTTCMGGIGTDGSLNAGTLGAGTHLIVYHASPTSCYSPLGDTTSVTITEQPQAGVARTVSTCATASSFQLLDSLGGSPDAGGSWWYQGAAHSDVFDPLSDLSGTYTYSIPGGVCNPVSADLLVSVDIPMNPAFSYPTGPFCTNAGSRSPNVAFGTFSTNDPINLTINASTGVIDVGASQPGTYTVTQTITNGSCVTSHTEPVVIVAPPSVNIASVAPLCSNNAAIALIGSPAEGTWSGEGVSHGVFDPAIAGAGAHLITYAIGSSGCVGIDSISITVNDPANATITYAGTPYCHGSGVANITHSGTAGGTFSSTSGLSLNSATGSVDLEATAPGTYIVGYSIPATNGCSPFQTTTSIVIEAAPEAGPDNDTTLCTSLSSFDLNTLLQNGVATGGTWMRTGNVIVPGGVVTPSSNTTGGSMTYWYRLGGTATCPADSAVMTINHVIQPNAGIDGQLSLCSNGSPVPLTTQLGASDLGGTWSGPSAVVGGIYDPVTMAPGTYTYTVSGTLPCVAHSATVTVTEDPATVIEVTDTACSTYTWSLNGETFTSSGTYDSVNGCVTHRLHLTIVVPGTACDDGLAATGNDAYDVNCNCTGVQIDCNGTVGGTAAIDACGTCAGGTTGITPNAACTDCAGVINGSAAIGTPCDDGNSNTTNDTWTTGCQCVGTPVNFDCAGVANGTAAIDACGTCAGGTTGITPNAACTDCAGVINGSAAIGTPCDDGNSNTTNDTWTTGCQCVGTPVNFDCAGVANGTAAIDACGTCAGGTTGITPNAACTDCAGVINGTAAIGTPCDDGNSNTTNDTWTTGCQCVGTPVNFDCAGVANGTAAIDACGTCAGGTTGITPNAACTDCAGVINGSAAIGTPCDDGNSNTTNDTWTTGCQCVGTPVNFDCAGVANGTAAIDACGTCAGGTTGITPNATCTDCAGVVNGTSLPGTACNDNDPTTVNDTWNSSCECIGDMEACSSDAGPDQTVCAAHATLAALGTGQWSGPVGILFHDPASPTTTIEIAAPGTHLLSWTVTQGACIAIDTLRLTRLDQVDPVEVSAGDDQYLEVTHATTLMAVATPGADLTWNLISGAGMIEAPAAQQTMVHGLGSGTNTFLVTATLGPCGSSSDTVRIIVKDLFIPQGFSPNGDGENDRFEITGMMAFPDSRLTVYNRWGQLVYENTAYANEWDGRSGSGQDLPDATYFYVLNLSGDRSYNGFIVIKR